MWSASYHLTEEISRFILSTGQVTRDEMNRLRHWLEVDRGVEFPARFSIKSSKRLQRTERSLTPNSTG
jgi:hypothetical protein